MANPYVRGAVTGVGVVTAVAGLRDLSGVDSGPQRVRPTSIAAGAMIRAAAPVSVPGHGSARGGTRRAHGGARTLGARAPARRGHRGRHRPDSDSRARSRPHASCSHWRARVAERAAGTATRVLVNDRADVASASPGMRASTCEPDGPPAVSVRPLAGRERLIGAIRACPVRGAARDGADLPGVRHGLPVRIETGRDAAAGLDALREACAAAAVPVLAIGGVTPERGARLQ